MSCVVMVMGWEDEAEEVNQSSTVRSKIRCRALIRKDEISGLADCSGDQDFYF